MVRRSSVEKRERIDHLEGNPNFTVHYGDLSDSLSLVRLIGSIKPDEIYSARQHRSTHTARMQLQNSTVSGS